VAALLPHSRSSGGCIHLNGITNRQIGKPKMRFFLENTDWQQQRKGLCPHFFVDGPSVCGEVRLTRSVSLASLPVLQTSVANRLSASGSGSGRRAFSHLSNRQGNMSFRSPHRQRAELPIRISGKGDRSSHDCHSRKEDRDLFFGRHSPTFCRSLSVQATRVLRVARKR